MIRPAEARDAARLSALHAAAIDPPWSAESLRALVEDRAVAGLIDEAGFILARVAADEAEILTLAVAPEARRKGVARALLTAVVETLGARGAKRLYLEVAADNAAARALYESAGFSEVGRRSGYYPHGADALVLARAIP